MKLSDATIGQVMIPVDDLDRGIAFYRDTLGLQFLFSAPPQMSFFRCGNMRLLVGVPPAGTKAQRGSTVYFRIPDIKAVYETLKGEGVKFAAEPHVVRRVQGFDIWLAEFTDPDGNLLALMSEVKV